MRAIGFREPQPITAETSLIEIELPDPVATGQDLLVEIKAISINPADAKTRMRPLPEGTEFRVLGWDAAGVVRATGPQVTRFQPGDAVFYAGAIDRPGSNAELHLVDQRIVAHKPRSLSFAEAAALPLTAITAWEALFDRLDVAKPVPGAADAIVIIGGAGGVGSIAIQLARQLTSLTVIATASRSETREWALSLGAHHVIDHTRPLPPQIAELGIGAPGLVFSTTHTDTHLHDINAFIAPQGRLALIDNPPSLDIMPLMAKSISTHWELMFTRSLFQTADMQAQGDLLGEVARLVDAGEIRTTLTETYGAINAANLKRAHAMIESHRTMGKIVLEGF